MQVTSNIQEAVKNKAIRNNTQFVINKKGEGYYHYNNLKVHPVIFEQMFPVEIVFINQKGENPDGTKVK